MHGSHHGEISGLSFSFGLMGLGGDEERMTPPGTPGMPAHLCMNECGEDLRQGMYGNRVPGPQEGMFRPNGIWHGTDPEYV